MVKYQRPFKPTICCDFDGVIHLYKSKWTKASEILDGPVDGAIEWIRQILTEDKATFAILSARSHQTGGIPAMKG
ncbi:hypothetical protein KAR91_83720 [Candidatus Pacearchaeota archaeon]|nr:hypothetical protein [Candidatus Pacearchaeota archaeon]